MARISARVSGRSLVHIVFDTYAYMSIRRTRDPAFPLVFAQHWCIPVVRLANTKSDMPSLYFDTLKHLHSCNYIYRAEICYCTVIPRLL